MSLSETIRRQEVIQKAVSLDGPELFAYLDQECGADSPLRTEIERIRRIAAGMVPFWQRTPQNSGSPASSSKASPLSRYELRGILGYGSASIVYTAHDSVTTRDVALKVFERSSSPSIDNRFLYDLRIFSNAPHDNIVSIYEHGETDDFFFIARELLHGRNLADLSAMKECGTLQRKLEIAMQIASAFQHIHSANIVHRGLTSGNVFVESSGRVHVMDFGMAHAIQSRTGSDVPHASVYLAPEQLRGELGGVAADVFAFGIVLYELIVEHPAARPLALDDMRTAGASFVLIDLVRRATHATVSHRPRNFSEILQILEAEYVPILNSAALPMAAGRSPFPWIAAAIGAAGLLWLVVPRMSFDPRSWYEQATRPSARRDPAPSLIQLQPGSSGSGSSGASSGGGSTSGRALSGPPSSGGPSSGGGPTSSSSSGSSARSNVAASTGIAPTFEVRPAPPTAPAAPAEGTRTPVSVQGGSIQSASRPISTDTKSSPGLSSVPAGNEDAAARLAREESARESARAEILSIIQRYAAAYQRKDVETIASFWPSLGGERQRLDNQFARASSIEIQLAPEGEPEFGAPASLSSFATQSYEGTATVTCRQTLRVVDNGGAQGPQVVSRVTIRLIRKNGRWLITSVG